MAPLLMTFAAALVSFQVLPVFICGEVIDLGIVPEAAGNLPGSLESASEIAIGAAGDLASTGAGDLGNAPVSESLAQGDNASLNLGPDPWGPAENVSIAPAVSENAANASSNAGNVNESLFGNAGNSLGDVSNDVEKGGNQSAPGGLAENLGNQSDAAGENGNETLSGSIASSLENLFDAVGETPGNDSLVKGSVTGEQENLTGSPGSDAANSSAVLLSDGGANASVASNSSVGAFQHLDSVLLAYNLVTERDDLLQSLLNVFRNTSGSGLSDLKIVFVEEEPGIGDATTVFYRITGNATQEIVVSSILSQLQGALASGGLISDEGLLSSKNKAPIINTAGSVIQSGNQLVITNKARIPSDGKRHVLLPQIVKLAEIALSALGVSNLSISSLNENATAADDDHQLHYQIIGNAAQTLDLSNVLDLVNSAVSSSSVNAVENEWKVKDIDANSLGGDVSNASAPADQSVQTSGISMQDLGNPLMLMNQ